VCKVGKKLSLPYFFWQFYSLSLSLSAASSSTNHLATGLFITSFTMICQHNHQLATRSLSNNGHTATSFFPSTIASLASTTILTSVLLDHQQQPPCQVTFTPFSSSSSSSPSPVAAACNS
jgi:hypothetical protein